MDFSYLFPLKRTPGGPGHSLACLAIFQQNVSAETRGKMFRKKSRVNFAGDFLVDFLGLFLLKKRTAGKKRKNPPQNPRQKANQNLGASRRKSALQGSGLDNF